MKIRNSNFETAVTPAPCARAQRAPLQFWSPLVTVSPCLLVQAAPERSGLLCCSWSPCPLVPESAPAPMRLSSSAQESAPERSGHPCSEAPLPLSSPLPCAPRCPVSPVHRFSVQCGPSSIVHRPWSVLQKYDLQCGVPLDDRAGSRRWSEASANDPRPPLPVRLFSSRTVVLSYFRTPFLRVPPSPVQLFASCPPRIGSAGGSGSQRGKQRPPLWIMPRPPLLLSIKAWDGRDALRSRSNGRGGDRP